MGNSIEAKRPLLSICIPTYNRAEILQETLKKIVSNYDFDDEVEIVISDNASTDSTREICAYFTAKYKNIKYFRNEDNIRDENFYKVLSLGQGEYLRLNNDWGVLCPGALEYMKDIIRANLKRRKPIFFTADVLYTKWRHQKEEIHCKDLDEYIQVVSKYVTAIFIFGLWREELIKIKEPLKYSKLLLNQVDWTCQLLSDSESYIYNRAIYQANNMLRKTARGGYNWFEVHLDNYYNIMRPYIDKGLISHKTYIEDKKNVIMHFDTELIYTYIIKSNMWRFNTDGTWNILMKYYSKDWYFWFLMSMLPFKAIKLKIKESIPQVIKEKIKLIIN